ncbi:MAG: NAD(P)/FAD-dependent oxidoreductase [Hylemonella sp.]
MTNHIILGSGPAGVVAAETIRKLAPSDKITLIGDEPGPPYSRMAIPYLLIGNIDEKGTYLRGKSNHFQDLNITLRLGRAGAVDAAAKKLVLEGGEKLDFDTLLIATGSRPIHPNIPGIDSPGVYNCWTLEDARAIAKLAKPGARVLQLGAGFIGCIIMEALAAKGVQLRVVERRERMVSRMMGPSASAMIQAWCESKGVTVHTGITVEAIEPGQPMTVRLGDGRAVPADLVISAAGVRPAVGFLYDSGIQCAFGVLTDERLQTNVPGIFAAGDCAEAFDPFSQKAVVSAIQPNAVDQARLAAANMVAFSRGAKLTASLKVVTQINVLDTMGLVSSSVGEWEGRPGGQSSELTDKQAGKHLSLQFSDDVMVGCNSVGWTEHVGVMRGLVEGRVRLGKWKDELMRDPTRLMEAYLASAVGLSHWTGAQDELRR